MKKSELKKTIKEIIIGTLNEETIVVDKTTNPSLVKGKDPNTVKAAVNKAKQTNQPVTIAEKETDNNSIHDDKLKETEKEIKSLLGRLNKLKQIKNELENISK